MFRFRRQIRRRQQPAQFLHGDFRDRFGARLAGLDQHWSDWLTETLLALLGFWFLEVSSLLFVYMLFNFFFSGHMFPIDMLPGIWGTLVKLIPLQYLAYFPAAVFLEKITGPALYWGLWTQFAWVVFFVIASRVTFHLGTRRYSGYGG